MFSESENMFPESGYRVFRIGVYEVGLSVPSAFPELEIVFRIGNWASLAVMLNSFLFRIGNPKLGFPESGIGPNRDLPFSESENTIFRIRNLAFVRVGF